MPVEEPLDSNLDGQSDEFSELDKKAKAASKSLKAKKKEIEKATKTAEKKVKQKDTKFEKKVSRIAEKDRKKAVKNFGKNKKSTLLKDLVGPKAANNLFKMGKNPVGFMTGIAKSMPFLGGVFAAKEIADFIWKELEKIDAFFKRFTDRADRRNDLVRSRQEQANISAGLSQKIVTTKSGGADARDAYNTFQIFNENQAELEGNYALSNNSGVP